MKPNKKTKGQTLELYSEQRIVLQGSKITKDFALTHFVLSYSQAPRDTIDPKLLRNRLTTFNPVTSFIHHPAAFDIKPAEISGSPELELPEELVIPAILAIHAVASMYPLIAKLTNVDSAHAHQMLTNYWQQSFNEDSPNYIPL